MREGPALAGWALNVITSVLRERSWGVTDTGRRRDDDGGREVGCGARAEGGRRSQNLMETRLCPGAAGAGILTAARWCWSWTVNFQDRRSQSMQS